MRIELGDCIVIKTLYENELRSLQNWVDNVNNKLVAGVNIVIGLDSANNTCD